MGIQKSLATIKRYTQECCNIILLTETNSFIKGAIYVAQMQKDIKDSKYLFRRYITLDIDMQAFKDIKLLFTRFALIYITKQYYKALELWFLPYTYKD